MACFLTGAVLSLLLVFSLMNRLSHPKKKKKERMVILICSTTTHRCLKEKRATHRCLKEKRASCHEIVSFLHH